MGLPVRLWAASAAALAGTAAARVNYLHEGWRIKKMEMSIHIKHLGHIYVCVRVTHERVLEYNLQLLSLTKIVREAKRKVKGRFSSAVTKWIALLTARMSSK